MKRIISPSILTVPKEKVIEKIHEIESFGIDWIHFDVMDGKFVPNVTFSMSEVKEYCDASKGIHDVHVMINEPNLYIEEYANAGADYLTFHYEALSSDAEVLATIDSIHKCGMKAGISIKPATDIEKIIPFLSKVELVLIMTVEPGKGGQKIIPETITKISWLKKYISQNSIKNLLIEVDGGINDKTIKMCDEAGADVFVVGSYLFDSGNIKTQLEKIDE